MTKRTIIILATITVIFILGVWFAFQLPQEKTMVADTTYTGPVFSDIRIGTPVRASFATQKNPPIKQKTDYGINEPILLQTTTMDAVTAPVSVTVRLLDSLQNIVPLTPDVVTLDPGKNEFCCWTIPTPGQYTLQVLRPDNLITNLPIKMTLANGS